MSADGSVTLDWKDGEDRFRLRLGEIRILQEKCAAGPLTIHRRLLTGDWYVDDVRETIRLGLIGGGLSSDDAMKKVRRSVDERPLAESVSLAAAVVLAAVVGVPDDAVGKGAAEEAATEATTASSSPPSTAPAQS